MMGKSRWLILIFSCILIMSGCENQEAANSVNGTSDAPVIKSNNADINTSGNGKITCTREAFAGNDVNVDLSYELEYINGYVQTLHSVEKIMSSSNDSLDDYEEAYKKIADNYKGLKYYDINISRTKDTVINDTFINYEKLDMERLLEIEGEEDNVVEDGKVKLETWLDFAEAFGTVCEEVK